MADQMEYLDFKASNGQQWRIWADGRQMVLPGGQETLAAHDLGQEFFAARQEVAWLKQIKAQTQQEAERAVEAFRQQRDELVKAREEIERLKARDAEWTESQAKAVTGYAQACALLERWRAAAEDEITLTKQEQVLLHDTTSFLVRPTEPSDGK